MFMFSWIPFRVYLTISFLKWSWKWTLIEEQLLIQGVVFLMAKLWEIVRFWVNYIPLNVKEFHYLSNYEEERLSEVLMPDILPHSW